MVEVFARGDRPISAIDIPKSIARETSTTNETPENFKGPLASNHSKVRGINYRKQHS